MRIFILFGILLLGWGCKTNRLQNKPARQKNILVLTDAGQRLELPRQAERDRVLIAGIFQHFEQAVRQHHYINARDRLQILPLPNTAADALLLPLQNGLLIDMQTVPAKEKAKFLQRNRDAFLQRVDSFYARAISVPQKQPSQTWKFFNEYLERYLKTDTTFDNYVIVLSDGYCAGMQTPDGEFTGSSALLENARRSGNWESFLAANRLKPVVLPNARIYLFFAEMQADEQFSAFPDELKMVQQAWLNWASFCNTTGVNKTLPRITEANVNNELAAFLRLEPGPNTLVQTVPPPPAKPRGEPAYLSREYEPPATKPVPEKKPEPVKKPETAKPETGKPGDARGGYSIRQDF